MKFRRSPIALAALAVCGALPVAAHAAPSVSWTSPANGAVLQGSVSGSACAVNTSTNTKRVTFWANNWQINNDYSPPFNCDFPTTQLSDGQYTLRAVAYDGAGKSSEAQISITINNSGTPTPTPTTTTPTPAPLTGSLDVWFKAPTTGATISGVLNGGTTCYANASGSVSSVAFFMDSTALNTDSTPFDGMQCLFDTTKFANGTHQLMATVQGTDGSTRSDVISVNVQNAVANAAPTVSVASPSSGQTVSGNAVAYAANASDDVAVARVDFFIDSTSLGSKTSAPYSGTLDSTTLANGTHVLKAVAYDAQGLSATSQVSINVQNTATVTPTPAPLSGSLDVWFKAPTAGATVSGVLNGGTSCYANASGSVGKVAFFIDSTALNTDSTPFDGMQCLFDTTKFANGTHQLKATVYGTDGSAVNDVISVNVQNATVTPSAPPSPAPTSSLPANGARAVATFESIGLYWTPPSNPGAGCPVIFRKLDDSAWRPGLDLWYDPNSNECRGSLVLLDPGTSYKIQLGMPGQAPSAGLIATTWSEQYPIAQTITLPAGTVTQPLAITQGGSASGYVVYQADPVSGTTIDVQNAYTNSVTISAPYVILRGFTLKGAQADAINLLAGARDLVLEGNDISGWGRYRATGSWDYGVDYDAGVRCERVATLERVVVQRNRIHDPRYGANSWDSAHPAGPQGMSFNFCGGNNVIRYNEVTSSDYRHFYNDGIGGSDNYTQQGFPNYDSDVYGNIVQGVMDDGLEIEGGDKNVRIWGNYLNQTGTGIASTVDGVGPLYIFRNVYDQSRKHYLSSTDSDDRGPFFKAGTDTSVGNGRRYVFHNTSLQAPNPSGSYPLGAGAGLTYTGSNTLTNTISRNNVYYIWKSNWESIATSGGSGDDVDYDLYNGAITGISAVESNGMHTAPTFANGNGVGMSGLYQLSPGTAGYGIGVRIPNFNDQYASPDMGAAQSGAAAMTFGVNATR